MYRSTHLAAGGTTTGAAPAVSGSFGSDLAARLAVEWRRLNLSPASRRRVRSWGLGDDADPAVVGVAVDTLDGALARIGFRWRGQDPATVVPVGPASAAMRRLLTIAPTDQLAARTLLERLVPGLQAIARQRREDQAFDELVAAAWEVIVSFNLARRPSNLPAALLSDCEYVAFRRASRRLRLPTAAVEPDHRVAPIEAPPAIDELTDLVDAATRFGKIDSRDVELLGNLLAGRTSKETAARMRVCERTVRYHRNDLVDRLRQVAQLTLAA